MMASNGSAGGVLTGEQPDGMQDDDPAPAENTESTGFDTPADANTSPDLPSDPMGGGKKGIPGALVLPPSPPIGTDTGKDPTPHPVKTNILTRATGKTATPVSPVTEMTPTGREVLPRKPTSRRRSGCPRRPPLKPIPPALTVGSTSRAGTVPVVVLARPHLALGTVADTIDPPLPPAKGLAKSQTLAPKQEAVREQKAAQTPPPDRERAADGERQEDPAHRPAGQEQRGHQGRHRTAPAADPAAGQRHGGRRRLRPERRLLPGPPLRPVPVHQGRPEHQLRRSPTCRTGRPAPRSRRAATTPSAGPARSPRSIRKRTRSTPRRTTASGSGSTTS